MTVFPDRAAVTRRIELSLQAGPCAVSVVDLPATLLPQSVRVDGLAEAAVRLGAVEVRTRFGAGTSPEAERRRYVELARSLRVEDRVYFTGAIAYEDIGPLMNLASVFVLPSYREPFGLVLLEALACGSRIVATDQGGPAEFVPNELKVSGDAILVPGLADADPDPPDSASFSARSRESLNR